MTDARYLDFDLEIWREGDQYKAEVRQSPAGPSERVLLKWPFDYSDTERENLLLRLENAVLKGRGRRSGPASTEEKVLREFGAEVFRAVLKESESVGEKFRSSLDLVARDSDVAGLRVKLKVDPPELAALPWEYMFDESGRKDGSVPYLCLRNRSPILRFIGKKDAGGKVRTNGPLRILAMVANPGGEWARLDTEAERRSIDDAWKAISNAAIELRWVPSGKLDDLQEMMLLGPWHIFHFIGHGGTDLYADTDGQMVSEGFVVMEDGAGGAAKVPAADLALMFEGERHLRLAVLNCCESGRGTFSSAGAELVRSGVSAAIAMQYAITNGAAARFAGMFYKSLAAGLSVERALTEARRHVRTQSDVEWGIPVLFARSDSSLAFDLSPATASPAPAAPAVKPTNASIDRARAQEELRRLFG